VPARYVRKQTIANGERFITDELAALQEQVEGADSRRRRRESELFAALLQQVREHARELSTLATFVADVDAVLSLAEVAVADRCVRPVLLPKEKRCLVLDEARHAVVERLCRERGESYVPSTIELNEERQILVVTGPNMAGKSTLMRQVALCQVLAQAGAFVPAKTATLSLCDRIFTRVGAADDTATGRSTFMVEMTETSHILRGATPYSLVLLDEIGRGTSTFDGLAIAWAVAEHIHDAVHSRTLFATHYHELTALSASLDRLKNVHVVVKEWGDDIVFVRSLADGPAGRSFGIQVARLAGLPVTVVARAREVLAHLEGDDIPAHAAPTKGLPRSQRRPSPTAPQMSLFGGPVDVAAEVVVDDRLLKLAEKVKAVDVNRLTPMQAMNILAELVDQARRA